MALDSGKIVRELRRTAELRRWFEAQETDPDIRAQYRAVSDKHINTAAAYDALADLIERDRPREPSLNYHRLGGGHLSGKGDVW